MSESPTERTPEESSVAPAQGALFDVLVGGDRRPRAAYTAIREIEAMAGQSVVTELRAEIRSVAQEFRAEIQSAVQELRTEVRKVDSRLTAHIETTNARFDSVQRQLNLIWTILILLLGSFLGTLTTVLLRG